MRVTKQIATEVAEKLLVKRSEKINKLKEEMADFVTKYYLSTIPDFVLQCAEKHGSFLKFNNAIYLSGNGFNHEQFRLNRNYPVKPNSGPIIPESEFGKKLRKMSDKISEEKKQYKSLLTDIEEVLFNMRTYSNVIKNFPEAAKLLPVPQITTIQINLEKLRQAI